MTLFLIFLFLPVVEGLNSLLMESTNKGLLSGFKVENNNEFKLTHLKFVDDMLWANIRTLKVS